VLGAALSPMVGSFEGSMLLMEVAPPSQPRLPAPTQSND